MSVPCLLIAALGLLGAPAGARADFFGPQTNGVEIGFVTVGQPGNAIDRAGRRGAVPVEYRISVTEVATRTVVRASELGGLRIEPVSFAPDAAAGGISWNQAARFVNWLNVDAGYSPAYKFEFQPGHPRYTPHDDAQPWEPGDVGYDPGNPQRNSRAMYVLPTEDEWYKAAYHDPVTGGYFRFPTGSDSLPEAVRSGDAAGTAVFLGSGASETAPVTMAGGMSPHGTMGQGGNAWEWVETPEDGPWAPAGGRRIMRGGGFVSTSRDLGPDGYATLPAGNRDLTFGFRVASRIRVVDANARLEGLGLSAGVLKPVHGTTESLPAVSAEFPDVALMWHEFFSCSSDSYQNAQMDSRPDFFPFESPLPGARRINQRVTTALAGALDGGGTWRTSSLGVFTPAFGSQFGTYSIETTPSGRDLPSSAGSGRLGGDLVLPDGRVIPAGARLYLDLQGHRLDPSQPSQLWHDAATGLTTQVYAGGVLDLYYRDAAGRAEAGLPAEDDDHVFTLHTYVAETEIGRAHV